MELLYSQTIRTPLGNMIAAANDKGICLFDFPYRKRIAQITARVTQNGDVPLVPGDHPYNLLLQAQIDEYFTGVRKVFDLPLRLVGTPFQQKVWEALLTIPYGTTRSYKAQSVYLNDEKAIRAVARANGENGLAILVPCHRVLGTNGSLTGYAGGLRNKEWLLEHERKHSGKTLQQSLFMSQL